MFIKIANSITVTRMAGREIDLNTIITITKIASMDTVFTVTRSTLVVSSRSFISGASPMTIPVGS